MTIVCWSRMEAVDWSRMEAVDWPRSANSEGMPGRLRVKSRLGASASRCEHAMNARAVVRADACGPVASDHRVDRLCRTAKDERALVVGCAASAGHTQQGDEPQQPCDNLSLHFAPDLTPPSRG